jgi:tight adherence protein B
MNASNVIIVAGVAISVAALLMFFQFIYWTMQSRAETQQRELSRRLGTVVDREAASNQLLRTVNVEQKGYAARLDDLIRQAGSPYPLSTLYTRMIVASVAGFFILLILIKNAGAIVGFGLAYIPLWLLRRAAENRSIRLTEQLPDGLDLLARSLQAGHGISEAMRSVAEEMQLPLAQEFGRVYEEHNLGRDFRECLVNLTKRNPNSFDLQIFVSSVLLQRDTGGNLVEILQSIANTVRARFVFHGKVRALTSEARFTAYILGGLPFFVITVIGVLKPEYLGPLFTDPIGQTLLVFIIFWFSLGVFVMREISQVEI